jgi:hypothetical protein
VGLDEFEIYPALALGNRSISSATPPEASRALPCTADRVVENSRRPNRCTPTSRISSVTKRKTSSSGAVQSNSPSDPTM